MASTLPTDEMLGIVGYKSGQQAQSAPLGISKEAINQLMLLLTKVFI